jgi:hypothetical protein
METDLNGLSEKRDALECERLELERAIGQQQRQHLAALAGEARSQAAELEESIDSLLTRLAAVNAEFAGLRAAPDRMTGAPQALALLHEHGTLGQ